MSRGAGVDSGRIAAHVRRTEPTTAFNDPLRSGPHMTFEASIAQLNGQAFWKEFTFSQNKFSPRPGKELELADNIVWLDEFAFVLQLKQRDGGTEDPDAERSWFRNKVLKKGTRQVRDTLRFLAEHEHIHIANERGHSFDIRSAQLTDITKIVVFLGARALPEECWQTRYHVSSTAGFIHVVAAHDYLGILEKLRVPKDIRDYFAYREKVVPLFRNSNVGEADIMGAFVGDEELPTSASRENLRRFMQDLKEFDLSWLIGNLHDNIQHSEAPHDYYQIMLEFARVPRSVWREAKTRFMLSLEAVQKAEFVRPFRFTFPATECTFMIAPLDPEIPATGPEGERMRVNGLRSLTYGAMYDAKSAKGVGILISKDGKYIQIDWCLMKMPWEPDPEMEEWLAKANPFRPASEKVINSFLFEGEDASEADASRKP